MPLGCFPKNLRAPSEDEDLKLKKSLYSYIDSVIISESKKDKIDEVAHVNTRNSELSQKASSLTAPVAENPKEDNGYCCRNSNFNKGELKDGLGCGGAEQ